MAKIFDFVNAKALGAYWTEATENSMPYLGETLFPARRQAGLDLSWIKGKGGLPVALKPSAFDAKATIRDRIGVTKIETEMPFFREAMRIGEKERQELLKLQNAGDQYLMPLIERIFDDSKALVDGALVQAERQRMQLLAYGSINIAANGVNYEYAYADNDWNTNNKTTLTSDNLWSAVSTADPIVDIRTAQKAVERRTGTKPTRAICNDTVWTYLLENSKIKTAINGVTNASIAITDAQLENYLLTQLGLSVSVYTKKYQDEAGVTKDFYPTTRFTLLPATTLGNTYFGTTPEEADLMGANNTRANVSVVNNGVAITTLKEEHPVNVETIVSEIVLPSFERMDEVHVLVVASES